VKEDAPLEYGDVLLMCVLGSKPDHAAILLDGNRILHHMGKRLSEITVYGGWYQKHTTYVIRHPKVKEHANKSFP
jgi:cell wall-associated NlpC family hydrolase